MRPLASSSRNACRRLRHRARRLRLRQRESDRALRRSLEDRRDRQTLGSIGAEGAGGDAVHADHALARHGDDRLAANDRERLHRIVAIERRAETSVPGASGSRNERTWSDDPRARDRDERARVEHLRAVVRDFGGFAMMELRDQPGVRRPGAGRRSGCRGRPSRARPCAPPAVRPAALRSDPNRRVRASSGCRPAPVR